jgi:multimeric flavodoxin WrbA
MKKILAVVGSARRKHAYAAAQRLIWYLESLGEIEHEVIQLSDYTIEPCRGCKLCLDRGEELCPLDDDRDLLIDKMMAADGVVFATPNYTFQVSGLMKVFLDRLGFVCHRPRFFGKTFTSIVAQGVYGGQKIVKYLDFVGHALGFDTVKGVCLTTREPVSPRHARANERSLARLSERFHRELTRDGFRAPTLFELMIFRMSRTSLRLALDESYRDYAHYRDTGWFESDYYYPVRLGPGRRLAGGLFERIAAASARK